jgi:hypothetical protein
VLPPSILQCATPSIIIAVAFLGTPHRGSDLAPFATGVAKILKAGGMRVNKDILQLLARDSSVLTDAEESFGIWLRKTSGRFNLTCFSEELELPTIGMVRSPCCRKSLILVFRIALTRTRLLRKNQQRLVDILRYQFMPITWCVY